MRDAIIQPCPDEANSATCHEAPDHVRATGWQHQLRAAVRDVGELLRRLDLEIGAGPADLNPDFPVLVPPEYLARIRPGDWSDPLLLQVLPQLAENTPAAGFCADPLAELEVVAGGIVRKYAQRALLIATGACPIHCRYCFRREFPYGQELASRDRWRPAVARLREDPGISEVILSGGDPLSLTTARLQEFSALLNDVPQVQRLRIHTRFPVTIPARIDAELLAWLGSLRQDVCIVIHCNHPNEINSLKAQVALRALADSVSAVLNQSVLLRGVNDDADVLAALSESLFAARVLPYYLHMLDQVTGTAHFLVDDATACDLMTALRDRLPGYLVPRLVREEPGKPCKSPVN